MITAAKCKICRRAGEKLFLKGEKCFTPKCVFERKPYPPGKLMSEKKHRSTVSGYGIQLREKQKVRNVYRVSEGQFSRYVKAATLAKGSTPVEHLFEHLERRLDNTVFRLGFTNARSHARQMVAHGHITVNGRKVTIPSYEVCAGDVVAVREGSRTSPLFVALPEALSKRTVPSWCRVEPEKFQGVVQGLPKYDKNEMPYNLTSIIEFYRA